MQHNHSEHTEMQMPSEGHDDGMAGEHAHTDHTGHEDLFRRRFWICLVLSIPVIAYSPMLQTMLGFRVPAFFGSEWVVPIFELIVFGIGGVPFLQMAVLELRNSAPGMMTLISLAILVALVYSVAAIVIAPGEGFFWELVTLIDVMLLGHWLEMRSVRQASRALDALAKLLPDTAERISQDGSTQTVPVSQLKKEDVVLVRPGSSIPADGVVVEGHSQVNEGMSTGESKPAEKEVGAKVIADVIRPESAQAVQRLHELGVRVVMLTGESEAVAKFVAGQVSIDQYVAEGLPENKDQQIAALRAQERIEAMVGDFVVTRSGGDFYVGEHGDCGD